MLNTITQNSLLRQHTAPAAGVAAPTSGPFGADGFTFGDLVDLVNPLQHIPVLGSYYRKWTGDGIAPAIRVAGGALFGGPLGAGLAAVGMVVERGIRGALERPAVRDAVEAPERALAARPLAAPGGWLVAASRQVPRDQPATGSVETAVATRTLSPRPGGWMVTAAYAMADEQARRAAVERSIDTLV